MKIKFKCDCKDKHTKKQYRAGFEYDIEDVRAKEILATGYAEEVKEQKEPEKAKKETKTATERLKAGEMVNLSDFKKAELVELAKKAGVSASGTKEDIIERLLEHAEND